MGVMLYLSWAVPEKIDKKKLEISSKDDVYIYIHTIYHIIYGILEKKKILRISLEIPI